MLSVGSAIFLTILYSGNWLFRSLEPTGLATVEVTARLAVFTVTIHLFLEKDGSSKRVRACQRSIL